MKKSKFLFLFPSASLFALLAALALLLASCGAKDAGKNGNDAGGSLADSAEGTKVDVDLMALSGNLVYAEVFDIVQNPVDYLGKSMRIKGNFRASYFEGTGRYYYYCIIADATACCAQGIEFVWSGEHSYPADFPADNAEITLEGIFSTYTELDVTYYCITVDGIQT